MVGLAQACGGWRHQAVQTRPRSGGLRALPSRSLRCYEKPFSHSALSGPATYRCPKSFYANAKQAAEDEVTTSEKKSTLDAASTTEKYGLEAGLWQVFSNKDPTTGKSKGDQAKDLLKRYGSAYLITSISFAVVSFATCYALVSSGIDVGALLSKTGIQVSDTGERVGTFAIAYAAHKALSPVRFPPTVALTPVVARWLGRGQPADGNGASK